MHTLRRSRAASVMVSNPTYNDPDQDEPTHISLPRTAVQEQKKKKCFDFPVFSVVIWAACQCIRFHLYIK